MNDADDTLDYSAIDPGIRCTVRWLRKRDYETTDSGDGVTKREAIAAGEALDVPHVFMRIKPGKMVLYADALRAALDLAGLEGVGRVEASYSPDDGVALIALYDVNDDTLGAATARGGGA